MSFVAHSIRLRSDADLATAVRALGDSELIAMFADVQAPEVQEQASAYGDGVARIRDWISQYGANPFRAGDVSAGTGVKGTSVRLEIIRMTRAGELLKLERGLYVKPVKR